MSPTLAPIDLELIRTRRAHGVVIGSRYTRQHVIRLDTGTGHFEEVNSRMQRDGEQWIQQALLAHMTPVEPPPTWMERHGLTVLWWIMGISTVAIAFFQGLRQA